MGPANWTRPAEFLRVLRFGSTAQQRDAAHALGLIRDARAVGPLVEQLGTRHWRTVFEAARALGRLGPSAGDARRHLEAVRNGHWSAVVRETASVAARRVAGEPLAEAPLDDDVGRVVDDHRRAGGEVHGPTCARVEGIGVLDPPAYEVWRDGRWSEVDSAWHQPLADPLPPGVVLPPFHDFGQVVVVEVANRWLVGRDAGEWGGDLVFVRSDGTSERIFTGNVQGFVRLGGRLFAVTGLAHLDMDEGELLELWSDGVIWQAMPFVELPHAVNALRHDPATDTLIAVSSMEAVAIDAEGHVELLPCRIVRDVGSTSGD